MRGVPAVATVAAVALVLACAGFALATGVGATAAPGQPSLAADTTVVTGEADAAAAGNPTTPRSSGSSSLQPLSLSVQESESGSPQQDGATEGDATRTENGTASNETTLDPAEAVAARRAVARGDRLVEPCAATPPANRSAPAEDAIGWEDGYWYDERVDADAGSALDPESLEAFVARTAARVEALRCLEFERVPTVRIANRSTVANEQATTLGNRSAAAAQFDQARLEATMLLPTGTDPDDARVATTSGATLGSYDPETRTITLVGSDENDTYVDETTLAHELVHALQDQHYDLAMFDADRTDPAMAETALVEGDASLVEHRYEERCEDVSWGEPCRSRPAPDGDDDPPVPLSLLLFQPYNDGPAVVADQYRWDGWSAVDALYAEPPRTTRQFLEGTPDESYERAYLQIDHTGAHEWRRIRPDDGPASDYVGPGAIAAALLAPTFEGADDRLYEPEAVIETPRQPGTAPPREYDYDLDAVEGWQSDRLVAFENDAGETASLWASRWETEDDAETFLDRYVDLLAVRGASPVDGHWDTYRFGPTTDYDGAVYVRREGTDVLVAHGPAVDALQTLAPGAAPEPRDGYATSADRPGPSQDRPSNQFRGPSLAVVAVAVLVVALALARRRLR